jgi:hypothetical protein
MQAKMVLDLLVPDSPMSIPQPGAFDRLMLYDDKIVIHGQYFSKNKLLIPPPRLFDEDGLEEEDGDDEEVFEIFHYDFEYYMYKDYITNIQRSFHTGHKKHAVNISSGTNFYEALFESRDEASRFLKGIDAWKNGANYEEIRQILS